MAGTIGDPPNELHFFGTLFALASASVKRRLPPPPSDEAPWLFSLRPLHGTRSQIQDRALAVRIYSDGTAGVVYNEEVPHKYRNHCLVTSVGNCILLKSDKDQDRIYLVDPFSSWKIVRDFPRGFPHSKKWDNVAKLVTHGDLAVAIQGMSCQLVYMRSGFIDYGWIARDKMTSLGSFSDLIFRNHDGFFYALSTPCDKVVRLKFVDDDADFEIQDITLDLGPGFDPRLEEDCEWCCLQLGSLVDSPSGLFLVRWRMVLKTGERKRREIDVYKLSEDDNTWVSVDSLDNYSFFLGINQSLAASSEDFPDLKSNLIYIPYDASYPVETRHMRVPDYMVEVEHNLIYDVKGKCWGHWDRHLGMEDQFLRGMIWPSVWMTPPCSGKPASKRKLEEQLQAETKAYTSDSSGSSDVAMLEQRSEPVWNIDVWT